VSGSVQAGAAPPGRSRAGSQALARFGYRHRGGATLQILPAAVLFALFIFWPFLRGLWLSFHHWDGFGAATWAGLFNYRRLIGDDIFRGALGNNAIFVVGVVVLKNVLGLPVALLLNQAIRGQSFFRAAVFVPVTMSFVAVGLLWAWIYNPVFGLLNATLDLVGLESLTRSWLGDSGTALYAIIFVDVWKWLGFHAVIYLAGLQTIPSELYESATMDGTNAWQRFWHVTLPLLTPIVFINTILIFSGAFVRNFDLVYVMTRGGPNYATEVVLTDMVREAFLNGAMGYASAMGYVLFLIVGLLSVALVGLMRRRSYAF
jgi:ABC-type sugar transport system permease subunit